MGIYLPFIDSIERATSDKKPNMKCEPIPLSKVGDYNEGNNSNITLLVEFKEVKSLEILDSGMGVALVAIQIWKAWEKLALRKT